MAAIVPRDPDERLAAVRRDLGRFDHALSAFPAGSKSRADQLSVAWQNFEFQLHHHHSDEETIFWPAFRSLGADGAVIVTLEAEHARMLEALDSAAGAMKDFQADPSEQTTAAARDAVACSSFPASAGGSTPGRWLPSGPEPPPPAGRL
jgi:hypothetical protein